MSACSLSISGISPEGEGQVVSAIATPEKSTHCMRNVAIATDFSEDADRAVRYALAIARHFRASLHFVSVSRAAKPAFSTQITPSFQPGAGRDCEELTLNLKADHELEGITCHRWTERGTESTIISELIEAEHIDLLVVGRPDRSGTDLFPGSSVAGQIFRDVRCPVLIVGPFAGEDESIRLDRILFATDLSRESLAAIPYIRTLLAEWRPPLDVLHVSTPLRFNRPGLLKEYCNRMEELLRTGAGAPIRCHLAVGKASSYVLKFAESHKEDLIVLGLKPHDARYSGSRWTQAWQLVQHAKCPVLCTFLPDESSERPEPACSVESEGSCNRGGFIGNEGVN